MNLKEIKNAVDQGKTVCVGKSNYIVEKDGEDLNILCTTNNHRIGLVWADGKTLNANEEEIFIKDEKNE